MKNTVSPERPTVLGSPNASVQQTAKILEPQHRRNTQDLRAQFDDGVPHIEHWRAMRFARDALVRPILERLGISPKAPPCGIGRVEFFGPAGAYYLPCEDGPAFAIIVPVVEFGDTIDLAAIDLETQHVATRLGIGKALGLDDIDRARWDGGRLNLFDKPLDWLREPEAAACIIDWKVAAFTLANLDHPVTALAGEPIEVLCSSFALAERIERAFARPLPAPELRVREA